MAKKRTVDDQEFNAARNQYDNRMMRVSQKYAGSLSPDRRKACCDMALWRCLQAYDSSYGQSVASSLHRFVRWECLNAIREQGQPLIPLADDMESPEETLAISMILDDYLSLLTQRDRRVIEARYLESCTFSEIAVREHCSIQGVKNIVDRSMSVMTEAAQEA